VEVEKRTEVELGGLEELDFSDVDLLTVNDCNKNIGGTGATYVLQRVDALSGLLDLTTNNFWDELGSELCKGAA